MKNNQLFTELTANEQENLSGGTLFLFKYLLGGLFFKKGRKGRKYSDRKKH